MCYRRGKLENLEENLFATRQIENDTLVNE